jgi:hypothetical protein
MGFDEGENTWEPVTTILEDAPDLLREFLEITSSALASKCVTGSDSRASV